MSSNDEEIRVQGSELSAPESARTAAETSARSSGALQSPAGDEDAIARAIAAGDHRQALVLCAREHGPAIGRLCMAMVGAQAEAEDLTQETLLAAQAAFGDFRNSGSVRAWLFGIARRKCARHVEQRISRDAKLRLAGSAELAPEPEEIVARRKLAEKARTALADIRPSEREALLLRYVGELSFREVGDACGIDEAAARKRVSRALARLRGALSGKEP